MQKQSTIPANPLSLAEQSLESQKEIKITPDCPPEQADEFACPQCGVVDIPTVEYGPFGPHAAKSVCEHCGRFVKWISFKTPEERQAAKKAGIERWMATQPATADQLAYLRRCGMSSRPGTMLAASQLIGVLKRGGAA